MTVATAKPSKKKRMTLTGRDIWRQTAWETSTKRHTSRAYGLNGNQVEFRIPVIHLSQLFKWQNCWTLTGLFTDQAIMIELVESIFFVGKLVDKL